MTGWTPRTMLAGLAALVAVTIAVPSAATRPARESPHGSLRLPCRTCHGTEDWSVPRGTARFDHATTGFPLAGQHAATQCRACHLDLTFARVGSACADCHADVHRGQLGPRCERCHSPRGWEVRAPLYELHAARGFPLVGVHAAVDCEACHVGQQRQEFADTPHDCFACHAADYDRTTRPPHAASGLPIACEQCHQPLAGWQSGAFDHARSGFALHGAHATASCTLCHAEGFGQPVPTECWGCHWREYVGAKDPPHWSAGLPTDCGQCHGTSNWRVPGRAR